MRRYILTATNKDRKTQTVNGKAHRRGVVLCHKPDDGPFGKWVVWGAWIADDGSVWGTGGGVYFVPNFFGDGSDALEMQQQATTAFYDRARAEGCTP